MTEILSEDTKRIQGKDALHSNIAAAKAVAAAIKTTLGPKGMDKMIVDEAGHIIITNDGVTILQEMHIEHPAGKMLIEVAKTQEQKVGDGTTTAVILAGELLAEAEKLIDSGIHPTVIINGYTLAEEHTQKTLKNLAIPIENRSSLLNIAKTAMTGKGIERYKEHLAELLLEALNQVRPKEPQHTEEHKIQYSNLPSQDQLNEENIKIETEVGLTTNHSRLINGIILDKERVHPGMPTKINEPRVLLIDFPLEVKSTEIDAKIQLSDPTQLQRFLDHEEHHIKDIIMQIKESGATLICCQRGIDDLAQYYLGKEKILALRRVKKSDMELLQKLTGAKIISTPKEITTENLGNALIVEEKKHQQNIMIFIEANKNNNNKNNIVTLLLTSPTPQNAEECKRAATDALGDLCTAIKDKLMVPGAGAIEIELALELEKFSQNYSSKTNLAIKAFARTLESIPITLAQNSGLDVTDSITALRSAHTQGQKFAGINTHSTPLILNTLENGILEPLSIKTIALASAMQVTEMILRIDDIILGKPKKNEHKYEMD